MPYPLLLLAGAALAAGGTGMQMAAASQAQGAVNSARRREFERQSGYQQEAAGEFQKSLAQSDRATADQQLAAGTAQRQQGYQELAGQTVGAPLPTRPETNSVVTGAGTPSPLARAQATTARTTGAWQNLAQNAQARLGGYEDWNLAQQTKNARANQRLAITGNLARSSAAVLPAELEQAQHSGDALASWGQLVGALGSVAGMAGAVAPGAPAAGTLASQGIVPVNDLGPAVSGAAGGGMVPSQFSMWSAPGQNAWGTIPIGSLRGY